MKEGKADKETLPGWRELLDYVKNEGTREVTIQRYKGLGEMNAEQLWETTMNTETRTLLKVRSGGSGGDRNHLLHADGRGRGEPAQVYRRERAGRAESGRLKQCWNAGGFRCFVERGIPGRKWKLSTQGQLEIHRIINGQSVPRR